MDDQEPSPNASSFEESNSSAASPSGSYSMSSNGSGSASSHKSSNNNARSNGSSMLNGYDESDPTSNAIEATSAITTTHPSYHDHSTYHSTGQFVTSDSFKNGIDEDEDEEIEEVEDDEAIDGDEDHAIDESFEPESADQSEQEDDDQENASVGPEDDLDAVDAEDTEEGLEAVDDEEEEEEEEAEEVEEEEEEEDDEDDEEDVYDDNHNDDQFARKSHVNHESFDDDGDEDAEEEDDANSGEIGDAVDEFVDEEEDESFSHSNVKAIAQADSVATSNSNSGHSRSIDNNNTGTDDADGDTGEVVTLSKESLSKTSKMQRRKSRHSIDSLSNVRDLTEGTNRVNFITGEFTSDGEDDADADPDADADAEADAEAEADADDNLIDSTHENNQRDALSNDPSADDEDDAAGDTSLPLNDDLPTDELSQSDPLSPGDQKLEEIKAAAPPSNLSDAELAVRNHFHREFGNIFDDGDGKVRLLHGQGSKTTEIEYFCIFCQHRTKDKDEIRHHYQKHMNYYPVICSSCGFLAFDLPHFLDHHASFHPKSTKGRYKRKEIAHVDRWINGFIYAQATIIKAFPPREQCPVCEIIFSPDEISASKPRRYTVNRKIDHVHRHLAYLPYECIKCKEVSGKEFLVGYFESKAHSHIKLKHPDVAIQDSRWYVFQKTLGIPTLDDWIANYLGKFGISMTHERRPVKKQRLIESNTPMDNFPLEGDTDGDDFDDDCPDLPEVHLEQIKAENDSLSSEDLMLVDVPPEMVDLDLIDTVEHDSKAAESADCSNYNLMEQASLNIKNTNYICIFCEGNFTNVNDISEHLASEHFKYQPILCLTCQNGFADMVTLSAHHLDCHESSGYELKFEVRENFSLEKWITDFVRSQKLGSFSKLVLNCQCSKYCPACCKVKKRGAKVEDELDFHGPCQVHNDSSFVHHIKTHLSYFQYQCLPCKIKGKVVKFVTLKGDAYNHLYREHVLHKRISASKIQSSFPKLLSLKFVDELIRSSLIAWKSNCGPGRNSMASNLRNITNNSDNAFGNLNRLNLYPVTELTEGILRLQEVIRQQLLQESMSPKSLMLRKKQQKLHQQQLLATRGIDYQSSLRVTTTQEGRMVVKSFKSKPQQQQQYQPSPPPPPPPRATSKTMNGGPGANINGYGQGKLPSNSLLSCQPQVKKRGRPPLYSRAENPTPFAATVNINTNTNANSNSNCNYNVNRNAIGSIVSNLTKSNARSNIKQMSSVNRPISNSIPQPKHQQQYQQHQQQLQQQQQQHQAVSSHSSHSNHIRIEAGRVVNLPQSPSPAINMSSSSNRKSVPKRSIYNVTNNSLDSHNCTTNNQLNSVGNTSLSNLKSVKALKPTMKVPSSSTSSSSSSLPVKCLHCNLTIPNLQSLKYHTINEHKGLTVNYMPVQSFVM